MCEDLWLNPSCLTWWLPWGVLTHFKVWCMMFKVLVHHTYSSAPRALFPSISIWFQYKSHEAHQRYLWSIGYLGLHEECHNSLVTNSCSEWDYYFFQVIALSTLLIIPCFIGGAKVSKLLHTKYCNNCF